MWQTVLSTVLLLYSLLAYLFWLYLLCLCVSAASRGCCLATANQRTRRGQLANAKSKLIIAGCKPNLRHTWLIWLANQSFGSKPQEEKAALLMEAVGVMFTNIQTPITFHQ